jgi:hypothetical protein
LKDVGTAGAAIVCADSCARASNATDPIRVITCQLRVTGPLNPGTWIVDDEQDFRPAIAIDSTGDRSVEEDADIGRRNRCAGGSRCASSTDEEDVARTAREILHSECRSYRYVCLTLESILGWKQSAETGKEERPPD